MKRRLLGLFSIPQWQQAKSRRNVSRSVVILEDYDRGLNALARPANTADGENPELLFFELSGAMIARRTFASGASSVTRTFFPSAAIPKSFHIEAKSTCAG